MLQTARIRDFRWIYIDFQCISMNSQQFSMDLYGFSMILNVFMLIFEWFSADSQTLIPRHAHQEGRSNLTQPTTRRGKHGRSNKKSGSCATEIHCATMMTTWWSSWCEEITVVRDIENSNMKANFGKEKLSTEKKFIRNTEFLKVPMLNLACWLLVEFLREIKRSMGVRRKKKSDSRMVLFCFT